MRCADCRFWANKIIFNEGQEFMCQNPTCPHEGPSGHDQDSDLYHFAGDIYVTRKLATKPMFWCPHYQPTKYKS